MSEFFELVVLELGWFGFMLCGLLFFIYYKMQRVARRAEILEAYERYRQSGEFYRDSKTREVEAQSEKPRGPETQTAFIETFQEVRAHKLKKTLAAYDEYMEREEPRTRWYHNFTPQERFAVNMISAWEIDRAGPSWWDRNTNQIITVACMALTIGMIALLLYNLIF